MSYQNRLGSITIRQSDEKHIHVVRKVKEIKNCSKFKWKVGQCEHLAIRLTCAADGESFENWTENRFM